MTIKKETVDYLNKKYHQTLLFDFYGELIKENNRQIYEDYIFNDLSLSEIADERGISRQGIHDAIKRTVKKLEEYESKIHLMERYQSIHNKVDEITDIINKIKQSSELDLINRNRLEDIESILKDIRDET